MKDYKPSERVEVTEYELVFYVERGCGLGFPCDENGYIDVETMYPPARANYEDALKHPEQYPYAFNKVEKHVRSYRELASGICNCGKRIELYNEYLGGCECPYCGQWWNMFGQELLPPERWDDDGELDYEY